MSKLQIKDFEKRITVRPMRLSDYEVVVAIQKACFPHMKPWLKEQLESMLEHFPDGQIVVEYEGQVVASSSSLIINIDEYQIGHTWAKVTDLGYIRNHNPEGDTLYGIEIMVSPDFRGKKLARRLYEARKQLCREKNLRRIVIGGRLPGFIKHHGHLNIREYVEKVQQRSLLDPVFTAQLANGFVLKRLIKDYLPEDQESQGWATLMEWVNIDYNPDPHRTYLVSRPARICVVQYQMRPIESFKEFGQQCEYFVDVASDHKSDFVLFPEIFTNQLLSYIEDKRPSIAIRRVAEHTPDYLELFSKLSTQYNINIIGGSHYTVEEDRLYNVSYLFKRNGQIGKQYKLHITPNERHWWGTEPGQKLEVFNTDKGKICIQVCYDIEFPEISRYAVEKGARLIFVPFCTDERHGYMRVRYCAQARCIENIVYASIAGNVGNLPFAENMDIQYAQSAILTPSDFSFSRDAIGAECTPNIETVVIHDVDLELLERQRREGSVLTWHDRRRDLYEVKWKGSVS